MKVKVSEATNLQLDWLVAKAQGVEVVYHDDGITRCVMRKGDRGQYAGRFDPITDWAQGGPILELEKIAIEWSALWGSWQARDLRHAGFSFSGPTPLIAAMRCFVVSKLGDEVEVPEELT